MRIKEIARGCVVINAAGSPCGRHPHGFTLLEVLIALLVLSVGMVGVAALSVQSVQNVHSSLQASIATAAALDFEERLWLDLGGRSSGCPDPGAIKELFESAWDSEREAYWLGLPGFEVIPATLTNGVLEFEIVWKEERFTTLASDQERFSYRIEILCR
jgi:type IV pilus assembly protein PilV